MSATAAKQGPWAREVDDFVRGLSGAFLFGTPLLFTMEMWWIATYIDVARLVGFLLLAIAACLGLTYFAGFKRSTSLNSVIGQTVDALGVGAVASVILLAALGEIGPGVAMQIAAAKVLLQIVPLSIGAAVANAVFSPERARAGDDSGGSSPFWQTLNDFGAAAAGALFVGFSIAPTDEVPMLAAGMGTGHTIALIGLSLLVSYGIVFVSGFSPQSEMPEPGVFQHPLTETVAAYAIALSVAATVLFLFGQLHVDDPLSGVASSIVVLGFPAAVGGAAGRLVV